MACRRAVKSLLTLQLVTLLCGIGAMVLAEATVPHTHAARHEWAFYNEEHDLGSLAIMGNSSGLPAFAPPLEPPIAPREFAVAADPVVPGAAALRGASSRAPPSRA